MYETIDLGFNYRMSEIHAAIGIEQLKKLPTFLEKRKSNYEMLSNVLSQWDHIRVLPQSQDEIKTSSHYCLSIVLDESISAQRPEIMNRLKEQGIGTSIYYPQPVPRMKYYKEKYGYNQLQYKTAATISDNSIAFPVGPHLDKSDMETISKNLIKILKNL